MKKNIQIQSHIYLNGNSLVSSSSVELLRKIMFLINYLPLAKDNVKYNHHIYYKEELFQKEILKDIILANVGQLPKNVSILITEHFLRSPAITRLPEKKVKSIPGRFFTTYIDDDMKIDEVIKNLKMCLFPGFCLYLEPTGLQVASILDIEDFDNRIIEYNREYISCYLKRCSEVSKKLERDKKISKFRYDAKDGSSFPHIHFSLKKGKEDVALNLIDLYFNEDKFWKHIYKSDVEVPKNIKNILKEQFKLP